MTWRDVSERLQGGASAILPIGAGAKQHGGHMPMATDQIQAEWFAERLAENIDAIIWPTVTYGHYPAFVAYAGGVSISNGTFEALIGEITSSLSKFGASDILVLNTGLSTIAPVDRALSRTIVDARHLKIYSGPRYSHALKTLRRQSHGSHADEIESSIMLAIAPDCVDMARAEDSVLLSDGSTLGPLDPTDHKSANFSASGSFGEPTLASPEKGRVFVQAILGDLLKEISGDTTAR
jgi:creatinine amidohydrolase